MTPVFKKIPPKPKNKTIDDDDNKKNNTNATLLTTTSQKVYSILDNLMSGLYDLTEKVTSPFRTKPTLQESLFEEDDDSSIHDGPFFDKYNSKVGSHSCAKGRCEYISQLIDELDYKVPS